MYEFRSLAYSLKNGGYVSGTELIETPLNSLSEDEMRNYQQELGFKDYEIEEMLHPAYYHDKPRMIDPNWYAELTEETKSSELVDAIVLFEKEFPFHIPIPPAFSLPDGDQFDRAAKGMRENAIEERKAVIENAQKPFIGRLTDIGVEIAEQYWIINGMHVRFPAEEIDSILEIQGVRSIERIMMATPDSLFGELDSQGLPYKTLLDNNRAIGIHLYKAAGYDGIGTSNGVAIGGRIKVAVIESTKFEENHLAFLDKDPWISTQSRVTFLRDCDEDPCATSLPEDVECQGATPQHGMASAGILAADAEDGQAYWNIGWDQEGHYSGVSPEASLSFFKASTSDAFVRGFEEAADLGIDVVSMSYGFLENEDGHCPNEEQWGANDAVSSAAMNLVLSGTILVKSAGNENPFASGEGCTGSEDRIPNSISAPGNSPYVVTVGAHWFLDHQQTAPTLLTLWDPSHFRTVSLIRDYSSRGITWQGYRKPNITAYTGVVHYPNVDRDKDEPTDVGRYADVNWWTSAVDIDECEEDSNADWWIRADNRYSSTYIGECFDNDNPPFKSHECVHNDDWPEWKNISVYREFAGGTSAAAPAVAGVMADFKDWYIHTQGTSLANDRGRIIANVLNFGDGAVDGANGTQDSSDADYSATYFGYGDDTYGAGRIHARLFNNDGMDSPYFWDDFVVAELRTGNNVQINLHKPSGGVGRIPLPSGADLLKLFVYWEEPFYNNYPANIQAVMRRTFTTNCSGTYFPVNVQQSSNINPASYTKGNWLHFVLDNTQHGTNPSNFSQLVENRCYQIDINGLSVPDGNGNVNNGYRRVYVAWFFEDLDRDDGDGPCRHDPVSCPSDDEHYLYFR